MQHIEPENYSMFTIIGHGWRVNFFSFKTATKAWRDVEEEGCLFLAVKSDGSQEKIDTKSTKNAK